MFTQFQYNEENGQQRQMTSNNNNNAIPQPELNAPSAQMGFAEMDIEDRVRNFTDADHENVVGKFAGLDIQEVKNIMANARLQRFSVRIKEIFEFTVPHINKEGFLFPAMMAAKIAGYNYTEEKHFIENVLKVQGREGVDWVSRKNKDIPEFNYQGQLGVENGENPRIEYDMPGNTEKFVLERKRSNNSKYAFVTERFLRYLVAKAQTEVGGEYLYFLIAVHDVMVAIRDALMREAASKRKYDEMRESTRQWMNDEFRKRAQVAEICQVELAARTAVLDSFKHEYRFLNEMGMDNRDKIYFKSLYKNMVFNEPGYNPLFLAGTSRPAIADAATPPNREISIHLVARAMNVDVRNCSARIGKLMARRWREANPGKEIPTRQVEFQGRPILENAYFETDRPMMEQCIREVLAQQN